MRIAGRFQLTTHSTRYTVTWVLFDGWVLVREWGRIGQAGTVRETGFETEGAAWAAGEQSRERKGKRGYRAVGG